MTLRLAQHDSPRGTHAAIGALRWVPSTWLAMGLAYAVIANVAAIFLRDLGLTTTQAIFAASLLGVPYVVKPLYAPAVELRRTKRFFVVAAQAGLSAAFLATGILVGMDTRALIGALVLLAIVAVIGSVQDIASEGLYLTELDRAHQTAFTGVQSIAWNGAATIGGGGLIAISGFWPTPDRLGGTHPGWATALMLCAILYAVAAVWHRRTMPIGRRGRAPGGRSDPPMITALASFFRRPGLRHGVMLCMSFPLSAGLIEKVEPFFLIDARASGGLGLARETLGAVYAVAGFGGLVLGAALGSFALIRRDLATMMMPMGLAAAAPAGIYLALARFPPPWALIVVAIAVARATLAFGMVGYVVYLQRALAPGPFPTSHYNLASGLKALTMASAGAASAPLQHVLGYRGVFAVALLCGLLALVPCRRDGVAAATA